MIGIVGLGAVGTALQKGFEHIGHEVLIHDIKYGLYTDMETHLADVLPADIIYICVGTPSTSDGNCDLSAVYSVIEELDKLSYKGIVALKSTSEPGTTAKLQKKTNLKLAYVPEFLRERCAFEDFVYNH